MGKDTIAGIATALSNSGISIIRVSGGNAFSLIKKIFKRKNEKELDVVHSHRAYYGFIYEGTKRLDEVLVLIMVGPNSYTGEDTVEIHCHGGVLITRRILEAVLKGGARPAEPGEFTRQAFMSGRIDLSQAEAVMKVIEAKNDYALQSSVNQLSGSVSKKIKVLREKILDQIAFIESALDDPEHISLDGYGILLKQELAFITAEISRMIHSFDHGKMITEGIKTVILGKPNAGKSSLMNVLLGEERAIVTEIEGTTRDTLEERLSFGGVTLNIVDTAGIRNTQDVVEKIGVERAKKAAEASDLIIYVVDASRPLDENDKAIISFIHQKKALILLNKTDLPMQVCAKQLRELTGLGVILVSAKEETGMEDLEEEIKRLFYHGEIHFNDEIIITSARQKNALTNSFDSLMEVISSIDAAMPEDLYSIDLMNAYEQLGFIIGESVEEDLVNKIFEKFCMGK